MGDIQINTDLLRKAVDIVIRPVIDRGILEDRKQEGYRPSTAPVGAP